MEIWHTSSSSEITAEHYRIQQVTRFKFVCSGKCYDLNNSMGIECQSQDSQYCTAIYLYITDTTTRANERGQID